MAALSFYRVLLMAALLLLTASCGNEKQEEKVSKPAVEEGQIPFDKAKWLMTDGTDYPYRDKMVADLFKDDKLKGLTKDQIVERLGEPTRTDKNYIFYRLSQTRIQFIPLRTKTLVIRLSPKGLSEAVLIHGG